MSPQAQLVMLLWIPVVFYLFNRFPTQKAVILGFIIAWLFLPQRAGWSLPGIPDYERMSATCYGILIATAIYDAQRFSVFKFGWLDTPMLILCICPLFSSLSNNLGAYDGFSASLDQTVRYGVPYFLGRIYLNNFSSLKELAKSILISGLIYIPLCLYESKMSPQLHRLVYGYHGFVEFGQSYRLGGYRPLVFMSHGLAVGMWMMAATLIAFWLWQAQVIKKVKNFSINQVVVSLLITFILVRSTGAYIYLLLGLIILFSAKWFRTAIPLLILIVALSSYLYLGATGKIDEKMVNQITTTTSNITKSEDRTGSLKFRLDNEQALVKKALQRPVFGWGGWGRSRIYEENWEGVLVDVSVTDSLWIITFGTTGWVGLFSLFAVLLIPAVYFIYRYPASLWLTPKVAPAAVLVVILVLYVLDNILNAMYNPVFNLASGAIVGMLQTKPKTKSVKSKVKPKNSSLVRNKQVSKTQNKIRRILK